MKCRNLKIEVSLLVVIFCSASSVYAEGWRAGVASAVITPEKPMWMAGYGSRKTPSEGKRTDLFAKALVLDDGKKGRGVVISLDLVGIDRAFSRKLCDSLKIRHGLERNQIAICTSHTHSGPVVGKNLGPLHYFSVSAEQQSLIDDYAKQLEEMVVSTVGKALESVAPARVQWGSGKSTFAVNRRNNKPYATVPEKRLAGTLVGPVDHDVPVLTVRDPEGALRAILFGYACHATVLSANEWNGDYPGYAQAELEKAHPGAVALFWAGCGGDQNPLPRKTVELAEHYGKELAGSVDDVIKAPMPELKPVLATRLREIKAPLAEIPTRGEISANLQSSNRFEVARARMLMREMEKKGALDGFYPYPVGYWKLGDEIDFFFLGGEVVVDYAVRLKREHSNTKTWVAAYANDVMAYIPSRRVLHEGGYEGGGSNVYYGLPTLWDESIEAVIVKQAGEMSGDQ
ncbi:MAG: neutral/alkaline non-lysosomal ceramidase N-terminal domain-containing protein [Verrucomicrobiales bacterium]|nr:neutral/alkaline non-lysosomal ceramidase N-terminal domain-containing protein [Verrucomicrobiales bacterium]